jgi:hypothetical protein
MGGVGMGVFHCLSELAGEAGELHDRVLVDVWPRHAEDVEEVDHRKR